MDADGVLLPADPLEDAEYFEALAEVFRAPDAVPDDMLEALEEIAEMGNGAGVERLQKAVAEQPSLDLQWETESSDLDIAMQVWLADAKLFAKAHDEHRLVMLTSFQHFGTKTPPADRLPFTAPTQAALDAARDKLDQWCAKNNRGVENGSIIPRELDGERWYLIEHAGTFRREAKREKRRTGVVNYWPGEYDVVVYSPARDEIRIHARSNGERKFYRAEFSRCLRDDPDYGCVLLDCGAGEPRTLVVVQGGSAPQASAATVERVGVGAPRGPVQRAHQRIG